MFLEIFKHLPAHGSHEGVSRVASHAPDSWTRERMNIQQCGQVGRSFPIAMIGGHDQGKFLVDTCLKAVGILS